MTARQITAALLREGRFDHHGISDTALARLRKMAMFRDGPQKYYTAADREIEDRKRDRAAKSRGEKPVQESFDSSVQDVVDAMGGDPDLLMDALAHIWPHLMWANEKSLGVVRDAFLSVIEAFPPEDVKRRLQVSRKDLDMLGIRL